MRALIAGLLMASGVMLAGIGIEDAGVAWWFQPTSFAEAPRSPADLFLPPGFVALLRIPRLGASVYVLEVKTKRDLRRGPGYIKASDRPGGKNCIIAGHRDLHFRMLKDLKLGDHIEIDSTQGQFTYRVSSFEIVSPTDVDSLRPRYSRQLTLVTCYPFYYVGPAPKRFLVRAELQ